MIMVPGAGSDMPCDMHRPAHSRPTELGGPGPAGGSWRSVSDRQVASRHMEFVQRATKEGLQTIDWAAGLFVSARTIMRARADPNRLLVVARQYMC